MILLRTTIATPLGPMLALVSDEALCALEFSGRGRLTRLEARLDRWYAPHQIEDGANAVTARTRAWLDAYFSGASQGQSGPDGLALDAREQHGIFGDTAGENLDGDIAAQPRVVGAIDLAHAARAEQAGNLVGSDACAAGNRQTWSVTFPDRRPEDQEKICFS